MTRIAIALAIAATMIVPAMAQTACPMTYEFFEFAVPHLDLASCPRDLAKQGVFCRASTGNDAVHVFVFAEKDRCLLSVKSYKEGEYQFTVK